MLLALLLSVSTVSFAQNDDYQERYQLKQQREQQIQNEERHQRIYDSNQRFLNEIAKLEKQMRGVQPGSLVCYNTFRTSEATQAVYEQCHPRLGCTNVYADPRQSYASHMIMYCKFNTGLDQACWSQSYGNSPRGITASCLDKQGYETKYATGRYVEPAVPKTRSSGRPLHCHGYRSLFGSGCY